MRFLGLLYISHLLSNMFFILLCFLFVCFGFWFCGVFFYQFDHCCSYLCKLHTSISLCCKGDLSYKHTLSGSISKLPWAAGIVIGCTVERHFPGGRMLLLTFKSASGYSLNAHSTLSYCPPPDFLSISVTKLSLKLLIKVMKLTFLC